MGDIRRNMINMGNLDRILLCFGLISHLHYQLYLVKDKNVMNDVMEEF